MSDITIANMCFGLKEKNGKVGYVPLGPLYVTAALEQEGYSVDFRDFLTGSASYPNPLSADSFYHFLADSAPVVGIGCTGGTLPIVLLAVRRLKQHHPDKTVILGGIGPGGAARQILSHFPFVDVIVRGEGERTMVELMEHFHQKGNRGPANIGIPGTVYRDETGVSRGPPRQWLKHNIDKVPFPAYHKINPHHYSIIGLAASRGCSYRCTFCDTAPFWNHMHVERSVENVIREIRFLHDRCGCKTFEFVDDTFIINREKVLRFCKRLKEENLDITWDCCGRIDLFDNPLMEEMAGSGCRLVFFGIESGSDRVLEMIKKGFNREKALQVIRQSLRYFKVMTSFIWGFPFETFADFSRTLDLIGLVSDMGATPWLFSLAPLPLSALYADYKHTLKFSAEWCRGVSGNRKTAELIEFVKQYPDVFPGFYYYDTGDFQEKYETVRQLNLSNRGSHSVFLDGLIVSKWS